VVRLRCSADAERYPNLERALALSIVVIQNAKETIFVPRCAPIMAFE